MPSKYLCVHILYLWITPIKNMALLRLRTGKILFSISARQEVSVKSILGHFWKNWNETNSNPGAPNSICLPSCWTHHGEPCTLKLIKKIIFGKKWKMTEFSAPTSRPLIWPTDSLPETWDYCEHSELSVGQIGCVEVLLPPRDDVEGFRTCFCVNQ